MTALRDIITRLPSLSGTVYHIVLYYFLINLFTLAENMFPASAFSHNPPTGLRGKQDL
jgi:hypothetical protein